MHIKYFMKGKPIRIEFLEAVATISKAAYNTAVTSSKPFKITYEKGKQTSGLRNVWQPYPIPICRMFRSPRAAPPTPTPRPPVRAGYDGGAWRFRFICRAICGAVCGVIRAEPTVKWETPPRAHPQRWLRG
ncbi:hypothetical protein EVAR_56817_1 [Eumeta japonica]|uniref:Uncharacterized protein n=1 Tax=Eumeta variegata TaxID=151549 RepID=A0A4C1Y1K8_EUMVA|nr:hypothetical protein EVAR_56817_1 [Eumeta japonica]